MYNVTTVHVYNVTTVHVYNLTTVHVYNVTTVHVYNVTTVHSPTGKLMNVGYSILNMFNKKNSVEPADENDDVFCLNKGDHQLHLYLKGPDTNKPLNMSALDVR